MIEKLSFSVLFGAIMSRFIALLPGTLLGLAVGWYVGYTRPVAIHQRELLQEYNEVRDALHMTDKQMADAGRKIPQFMEDMKRADETVAVVALSAFRSLEEGDVDDAKKSLAWHVGSYYRLYHEKGGDADTLAAIEDAARQYPAIAAEVAKQ